MIDKQRHAINPRTFPLRFHELRKEKRLSVKEAAAAIGVSERMIYAYENTVAPKLPDSLRLRRIASVLDVGVDGLFE